MEATEKIIQRLHDLQSISKSEESDPLLGLFADDSDLVDQIMQAAMRSREKSVLRNE